MIIIKIIFDKKIFNYIFINIFNILFLKNYNVK